MLRTVLCVVVYLNPVPMKNLCLLFVAFSLAVFCSSCETEDPVWGRVNNSYRISQATYYNNGIEYAREDFAYQGNYLTSITRWVKGAGLVWEESEYTEMLYEGDRVYMSFFIWDGNQWANTNRADYVVRNGLMMEELDYDLEGNSWVPRNVWSYRYSGANITAWDHSELDDNGAGYLVARGSYAYQSGNLLEQTRYEDNGYGVLNASQYTEFFYSASVKTGFTEYEWYNNQWVNSYGEDYSYVSGKVSSIASYDWDGVQWVADGPVDNFYYNAYGYLAEEIYGTYRSVFDYEPGSGNARFFWYYPENLAYGRPVVKSVSAPQITPFYLKTRP